MEECLDLGPIGDFLNFNDEDDDKALNLFAGDTCPNFHEEQQEELEWISNFPPVDEYVLAAHQNTESSLETNGITINRRSQRRGKQNWRFADIPGQEKADHDREMAKTGAIIGRKCRHCGTEKTPQWRAGPFGPKTLCNACGVRHKTGRLVPEYRPASSPSFSGDLHSNFHRKIVAMRRVKESG